MLTDQQHAEFQRAGHVTIPNVFGNEEVQSAIEDIDSWSKQFLSELSDDQHKWYLEQSDSGAAVLRKLDNPVFNRLTFQQMAKSEGVIEFVEQLIGEGVSVFYSQIFCKPPEIGGPKPVHQDNFYFGPSDLDSTLTVWIALDEATTENGCLYYGDESHLGPVYQHSAPEGEPFNLQVPSEKIADFEMTPAPVPAGGVSLHHGNTWHQSSSNNSPYPRRAAAFHYIRNGATLVSPALKYDDSVIVKIS